MGRPLKIRSPLPSRPQSHCQPLDKAVKLSEATCSNKDYRAQTINGGASGEKKKWNKVKRAIERTHNLFLSHTNSVCPFVPLPLVVVVIVGVSSNRSTTTTTYSTSSNPHSVQVVNKKVAREYLRTSANVSTHKLPVSTPDQKWRRRRDVCVCFHSPSTSSSSVFFTATKTEKKCATWFSPAM